MNYSTSHTHDRPVPGAQSALQSRNVCMDKPWTSIERPVDATEFHAAFHEEIDGLQNLKGRFGPADSVPAIWFPSIATGSWYKMSTGRLCPFKNNAHLTEIEAGLNKLILIPK